MKNNNKLIIQIFLIIILLFSIDIVAQEDDDHDFSKEETDEISSISLLAPDKLEIGIFPNSDGFMDAKFNLSGNYMTNFSSGVKADYSSRSNDISIKDEYEAKTITKELYLDINALDYIYPMSIGKESLLGFKGGASIMYLFDNKESAGYKNVQSQSVYFNEKKSIHNITPAIGGGLGGVFGSLISFTLDASFLPFVVIRESGEKRYSTYENAIPYSVTNYNIGYQAKVALERKGYSLGDFELFASFLNFSGEYMTKQEIITGNYKTTVKTVTDYTRIRFDAGFNYKMTYLQDLFNFIPIVSLAYSRNYESFDGSISFDEDVYKIGLMIAF
jgi:hypothetical protein